MQPMHVPAGATIFRVGDPSSAVYVIEDGEVAITVNGGIEVARLHAGALFGESGVLEARIRAATATAILATTLLVTDGETFFHAFGMDNDRALTLVKLLCSRLRSTTARAALPLGGGGHDSDASAAGTAAIRLLPDSERLTGEFGMVPIDVRHLPFQVGNRFGGETLPIASNHYCCIPARGVGDLAAPHFEILRRDGLVGVRDLGTSTGTCVNGTMISRASLNAFVALRQGDNEVIAGGLGSPFRFCVRFAGS
jgi:CRP/FNR family transcriptional regulator, cyclic AMP receptor protein